VSARVETGAATIGVRWRDPAVLIAVFGGGVMLVEAMLAALLIGLDVDVSSPTRTALVLGVGGLAALGAARLVSAAPRLASPLCLVAATLAALVFLSPFAHRLHARYWGPSFQPGETTLGQVLVPMLAFLLAAAPLVCAAVLARRQAWTSPPA
jgi:hypothetical protein